MHSTVTSPWESTAFGCSDLRGFNAGAGDRPGRLRLSVRVLPLRLPRSKLMTVRDMFPRTM